jgi:hypothetical protein
MGKTIINRQISSVFPAMASQPVNQRKLGLIEGQPTPITYSKKAKPMVRPLRPRTPWRNEQRRSSAMNSRRFIRSSSQLEGDRRRVSGLDGRRTQYVCKCCVRQGWCLLRCVGR